MAQCCTNAYTLFIDSNREVWCTGLAAFTTKQETFLVPTKLQFDKPIVSVTGDRSFVIAVDTSGDCWVMGYDYDNPNDYDKCRKIKGMSNVVSVGGGEQLLWLDKNDCLWECNNYDSLFHGNISGTVVAENVKEFSISGSHYMFITLDNSLFACGGNSNGQLGVSKPKATLKPIRIEFDSDNISSLSCGLLSSAFISYGKCFVFGCLNPQKENSHIPTALPNLRNAKKLSCCNSGILILDDNNHLYGYGMNPYGELGLGKNCNAQHIPKLIEGLPSVADFTAGYYFTVVKCYSGEIYSFGYNDNGQLGIGNVCTQYTPCQLDSEYKDLFYVYNDVLQDIGCWNHLDIQELKNINHFIRQHKKIIHDLVHSTNNETSLGTLFGAYPSWKEVDHFLEKKIAQTKETTSSPCPERLAEAITKLESTKKIVQVLFENEISLNKKLAGLLKQKQLSQFKKSEIPLVLWKMNLCKYQQIQEIDADVLCFANEPTLLSLGMKTRDVCCLLYYRQIMMCAGYWRVLQEDLTFDCCICNHNTSELTIELLKEYNIALDEDIIIQHHWTAPYFLNGTNQFTTDFKNDFHNSFHIQKTIARWNQVHNTEHICLFG